MGDLAGGVDLGESVCNSLRVATAGVVPVTRIEGVEVKSG